MLSPEELKAIAERWKIFPKEAEMHWNNQWNPIKKDVESLLQHEKELRGKLEKAEEALEMIEVASDFEPPMTVDDCMKRTEDALAELRSLSL